jgi:RHS repeat-associated protein
VQTTNSYDPDGRVISVARANGAASVVTTTSYSLTGKVQSVTDPNGNLTLYAYDLDDRLASVTQPVSASLGRVTSFTYDALSRLATVIDNQGNTAQQYSYTPNGRQASFTDAHLMVTAFSYDGFDRLAQTTYGSGTSLAASESYGYDADDNMLSRTTRRGDTLCFAYDNLNRLSTKTTALMATSCASPPPSSPVVSYGYDLAGRATFVGDNSAAIAAVGSLGGPYTTGYVYDQLNRPTNLTWSPAATAAAPSGVNASFGHGYNGANQRITQSATDNSWWYYPAGLTSDVAFTYGYDAENRLVSASGAGNTASYAYDGRGRRKLKTVNGTTTIYVTDANNREVLEYDGTSGQVARWYAYGLGPNEALNQMNVSAGTRETFIPDIQGSMVATLDSGTGTPTKQGYLPYGENPGATGTFAYTGQRIDPETGLYYYRARMYATNTGVFTQTDPIGFSGGNNLYAYVGNDALNRIDPFGFNDQANPQNGGASPSIGQRMFGPYVDAYQNVFVSPLRAGVNALAQSPLGDPGLYQSLQGLGAPGAFAAGFGSLGAYGLRALAGLGQASEIGGPLLPSMEAAGGKTFGVLQTSFGDTPLISGQAGPASEMPLGSPGFDAFTRTHVEGHAAAMMQQQGLTEGTLYLNNPNICSNCMRNLPSMLPSGSNLNVVLPNGTVVPFTGVP